MSIGIRATLRIVEKIWFKTFEFKSNFEQVRQSSYVRRQKKMAIKA